MSLKPARIDAPAPVEAKRRESDSSDAFHEIKKAFLALDVNGDQKLDKTELSAVLEKLSGTTPSAAELDSVCVCMCVW